MTPSLSQADILAAGPHGTGVLLVPKFAFNRRANVTSSPVAGIRAASSDRPSFRDTSGAAARQLERLGLKEVTTSDIANGSTARLHEREGVFARFNTLGFTAAYFHDMSRITQAREGLGEEFEVVPDFRLALPSRLRGHSLRNFRDTVMPNGAGWPISAGIADAHERDVRGAGVLVGVLDTGIDADHLQFQARNIPFRYVSFNLGSRVGEPRNVRGFDIDGHGTHVCGIIAGSTIGVAPGAELMVASVIESETTHTSFVRILYGLDWLMQEFISGDNANKPALINLSLSFPSTGVSDTLPVHYNQRMRALEALLQTLVKANVLPIVAIGNDGPGRFGYPGGFSDALGVGAVDFAGKIADFSGSRTSSRPRKPDIYGYGVGIYSSIERDMTNRSLYAPLDGTSMAAPYVTGIAALYLCQYPALTAQELRAKLLASAQTIRVGRRTAQIARYV